ncbi:MAG: thioredoxin family protein [Bacteroidota bacterium]
MYSRTILIIACLISFLLSGFRPEAVKPLFQSSVDAVRQEAQNRQKPYFIYFYQEKNHKCRKMKRQTWRNQVIREAVNTQFLACQINAMSDEADINLIREHNVYSFPCLLFFNADGRLSGRVEGFVSPETMQHVLRMQEKEARKLSPTNVPKVPTGPAIVSRGASENVLAMASRGGDTDNQPLIKKNVENFSQYSLANLELTEEKPSSFGLLVGSYTQTEALRIAVERYDRFWDGKVWIYAIKNANQTTYKVVLGDYPSMKEAEFYAASMYKIKGMNPSIIRLHELVR